MKEQIPNPDIVHCLIIAQSRFISRQDNHTVFGRKSVEMVAGALDNPALCRQDNVSGVQNETSYFFNYFGP